MAAEGIEAISALLIEAEQAHGVYETSELGGIYDEDWPRWYARHIVEHGIGALVGHDVSTDELAAILASSYAAFSQAEPRPTESWATYTARRIGEGFEG